MKLVQIKLAGFKSFVDATIIDIKGQLIGIVGPNGCGKSNVIDAVRWVLGESSARQLRGESMHDVIFNGSVTRKAVSRASVELVFDNQQKILTNAWNSYDEISIKRVLSRSGESVYLINNQVVRRKDVTELFLGTGVGTKGYAVIEQGMISRIIESRPEDLRMYLEEAAGVSKYREKRKDTLSRLEYTRENLVRLEDIKLQLADTIESLSKQAQTAKQYQDIASRLTKLQLTQLLVKMDKAKTSLGEINLTLATYQKSQSQLLEENQLIEDKLTHQLTNKHQEEQQLLHLTENFNQLRAQIARLEERHKYKQETVKRLLTEQEQLQQKAIETDAQLIVINEAVLDTKQTLNANTLLIKDKEVLQQSLQDEFTNSEQDYQKSLSRLAGFANNLVEARHEVDLLNNSLRHKDQQLNNLQHRRHKLEQETPENTLNLEQSYTVLKEQIEELNLSSEEINYTLQTKKDQKQDLDTNKAATLASINQCKNTIAGINANITTIDKLFRESIKDEDLSRIIPDAEDLSPLWQGISVDSGYETAAEVVLGRLLSAKAVNDLAGLAKLPENTLALWHGNATATKAATDTLAAYVTINDIRYQALYSILNRYQVADDFATAINMLANGSPQLITKDGHLLTQEYVIFNAHHGAGHVLEYQNQLQELSAEYSEHTGKLHALEKDYQQNLNDFNAITATINTLEKSANELSAKKHALQIEFTKQEQNYEYSRLHHERISSEIEILEREIAYIKNELLSIQTQITTQAQLTDAIKVRENVAKTEHTRIETIYTQAKTAMSGLEAQILSLTSDKQLLQQRLNSSAQLVVEKETQLAGITARVDTINQELKELDGHDESVEVEIAKEDIIQLVQNIDEQKLAIQAVDSVLKQLRDTQSRLNMDKDGLNNKLNQALLKQQEYTLSIQNLEENITNLEVADYSATELLSQNNLSLALIQEQITKLRQELDSLGLVNLKAIEDLEESENKYAVLDSQINDLTTANKALEEAILQIDGESRKLLLTTYTKVNENFNNYFKILFGGGQAKLVLTEEDILVAGLHVYAEPTGKKYTSLYLLSGGEKALTAVSLIFALFSLNPAPFCILDEVDAPLDDANTMRFCNLVKELSIYTQFIYITHNRLAMEMAEQLIGVTMQEKGVSTTVAVNLVDNI